MLLEQHFQPCVFVRRPRVFPLERERLKIFLALFCYPCRFFAKRQWLHLGKVNERAVLLCPLPELIEVDDTEAVLIDTLCVNRKSTVLNPAFHLVAAACIGAANGD